MNAAEGFLTNITPSFPWEKMSNEDEIFEEIRIACVFANPFMTRLEEPLAFSDPPVFKNGKYSAKPGVFGKIIQSYMDKKITLREFGRLMGKFSETCTRHEWREFYKRALEQRLLYRGQSANPFYQKNLVFPKLDNPPDLLESDIIPYAILGDNGKNRNILYGIRVGKGHTSFYKQGFPIDPKVLSVELPKFIESLAPGPVEYFLEINLESRLVTDIVPWEMYWNESPYPSYMVRREILELIVPPEEEYFIGEIFENCTPEEIKTAVAERGNVCVVRKHDGRYAGIYETKFRQ